MKERRFAPRYPCNFEIQVVSPEGQQVALACNISTSGIAVQISRDILQHIGVDQQLLNIGDELQLQLPPTGSRESNNLAYRGQVQYIRRLSQESYQLGLQFAALDNRQLARLDQWIGSCNI